MMDSAANTHATETVLQISKSVKSKN